MRVDSFACIRPAAKLAREVAALPYDVFDRAEARTAVEGRPLSFLNIDRPETQFAPDHDMYADDVYAKARELFETRLADGTLVEDVATTYYLYRLEMGGRSQTGFVGLCPADAFLDGTVKRHETTRPEKERDRIRHIEALEAQTGPIFLTYRRTAGLADIAAGVCSEEPFCSFQCDDGVRHTVWRVTDARTVDAIRSAFEAVPCAYIADGHHRAAAAVHVAQARKADATRGEKTAREADTAGARSQGAGDGPGRDAGRILGVLFPDDELTVLPYNRLVRDLGENPDGSARDCQDFISDLCRAGFSISTSDDAVAPSEKGTFGMYLGGSWWILHAPELDPLEAADPVLSLDASRLQELVLGPVLGIADPRTDERVSFVGGIRGTKELERQVDEGGWSAAFSLRPTSIDELLAVADAGRLMPPKSTWFEPKLRSGLFIHRI